MYCQHQYLAIVNLHWTKDLHRVCCVNGLARSPTRTSMIAQIQLTCLAWIQQHIYPTHSCTCI